MTDLDPKNFEKNVNLKKNCDDNLQECKCSKFLRLLKVSAMDGVVEIDMKKKRFHNVVL